MTLSAVFVYPVKALRGVAVDRAEARAAGLKLDREWMIVDAQRRVVTQIQQPRLACVDVVVEHDALLLGAPGMPPLVVPRRTGTVECEVKLFAKARRALAVSRAADRWLTDYLGVPCSIVRMPPGDSVSFANQRPFHLVSSESWHDLAVRVAPATVPMNRFRPNFVVSGAPPYEENEWTAVNIGSARFRVTEPCARCAVTCVDANTGTTGVEPLRTLTTLQSRRTLLGRRVQFGLYVELDAECGSVTVGDAVSRAVRTHRPRR